MGIGRDLLLLGSFGLGLAGIYMWIKEQEKPPAKFSLILEATEGGTTTPPPGTYDYTSETTVTVTAIPYEDYEFDGWFISGEKVSTDLTYTLIISEIVLLVASFKEIGAPPLIPAYIRPIQNALSEQWWKVWTELEVVTDHFHLGVDFQKAGYVKFKICDVAGNGVAGQSIAVYTDPNPDELDFGYVFLNDGEHTESNPLILTSDASGVVSIKVDYKWIEPYSDYEQTIGYGGKLKYCCPFPPGWCTWVYPVKDGHYINRPCAYARWTRMKNPIFRNINYIHAYWVDNPSLPVWGDAVADCMIKIEESREL